MALQQQSGFAFPCIAKGPRGRVVYTSQDTVSLIKFSIAQIILTVPGERFWNPSFGCRIRSLQFEQLTPTVVSTAQSIILLALNKWETRIALKASDIIVVANTDVGSTMTITISFQVVNPDFTATQQTSSVTIVV